MEKISVADLSSIGTPPGQVTDGTLEPTAEQRRKIAQGKLRRVRSYTAKPGTDEAFKTSDGKVYKVAKSGSLICLNKPTRSKKERNREKRMAARA